MSDQGWITPYTEFWNNIKQTSDENKEKYQIRGSSVDPIPNSPK